MKGRYTFPLIAAFALCLSLMSQPVFSAEKWSGVDESVVEKFAASAGRHPVEPLLNTDQGDLLLFVFLLAGAVGGFIGGYYWRVLMESRKNTKTQDIPGPHSGKTAREKL